MFKIFSRKSKKDETKPTPTNEDSLPQQPQSSKPVEAPQKESWFARLKNSLSKTRNSLTKGISNLILGHKELDEDLTEEIETQLISADVGIETTQKIIADLTDKISRKTIQNPEAVIASLKEYMTNILLPVNIPFEFVPKKPMVLLMVGVNGAGKTTTIGKLANQFKDQNLKVMLAAGDTFRAAAVEQLKVWGERNDVPVIAQETGSDSASVVYDAMQAAMAREYDILIADTAGRLHSRTNLMEELKKIKRVLQKLAPDAPHEVLLVLDAGIGQNAILQAQEFNNAIGVDGLVITKLDGTAKGGVIFAIADQTKLPIRFIGLGEQKQDLRAFNAKDFVDALFDS